MRAMPYKEARGHMRLGDPIWTADPGVVGGGIRLLTGEPVSHIGAVAAGWPDATGRRRVYVAQSNLGRGIHLALSSEWIAARRGRVYWMRAPLTHAQRAAFNSAVGGWLGRGYEDAWGFARQALGLPEESGVDRDKVCSAAYSAWWKEATGAPIPGTPWLRFIPTRPGKVYAPSPGDVLAFLTAAGGELVEVIP